MEGMINELPPTLKEEVFFNQFGDLIQSLDFFNLLGNNECKWGLVREMSKLEYNKGDEIYNDQELAVANSLEAVRAGASMVQGTERSFVSEAPRVSKKVGSSSVPETYDDSSSLSMSLFSESEPMTSGLNGCCSRFGSFQTVWGRFSMQKLAPGA